MALFLRDFNNIISFLWSLGRALLNIEGRETLPFLSILFTNLPYQEILPEVKVLIIIFSVLYVANLFQKCFLGDNGSYVISAFMSFYIITFINLNDNISPLLAVNLLWYPAFENLFTIIRRTIYNKKVQIADRSHLHILILEKIFI